MGFNNEDNCYQSQEFEKSMKKMLLKGILSIRFWQVYNCEHTNNVYTRVIFSTFYFFPKIILEIWGCGFYTSFHDTLPDRENTKRGALLHGVPYGVPKMEYP